MLKAMDPSDLPADRSRRVQRLEYAGEALDVDALPTAPWALVEDWVRVAHERAVSGTSRAGGRRVGARVDGVGPTVIEPAALELATVDADGAPDVRTVLCRDISPEGLQLFTSLVSAKARQIQHEPRVAVTWTWPGIFRALRFRGLAEELPRDVVDEYFRNRPWGARIGAHASRQSHPLENRDELVAREAELVARWPDTGAETDVPTPEHWGGFLVRPTSVEVWTGRVSRLHDRWRWVQPEAVGGTGGPRPGLQGGDLAPLDDDAAWTRTLLQP